MLGPGLCMPLAWLTPPAMFVCAGAQLSHACSLAPGDGWGPPCALQLVAESPAGPSGKEQLQLFLEEPLLRSALPELQERAALPPICLEGLCPVAGMCRARPCP